MKIWSSTAFYCLHLLKATLCFKEKVKERYHNLFNISSKAPVTEKLNYLWTLHRNVWLFSQETFKAKTSSCVWLSKAFVWLGKPWWWSQRLLQLPRADSLSEPQGEAAGVATWGSWCLEILLPFIRCFQPGTSSVLSEKALSRVSQEVLEPVAFHT